MESIRKPGAQDAGVPYEGILWYAIDSATSAEALATAESMLDDVEDRLDRETVRRMRAAIELYKSVQGGVIA